MATKRDLLAILDASKRKPQSAGYRLRLQLADLLLRQLRAKGWTQKQLAKAARMKESFITRVIHAESNCTFDVAGRLLFAAGVSAALAEASDSAPDLAAKTAPFYAVAQG